MKCPDCKQQLKGIPPLTKEEWLCDNTDCPANKESTSNSPAKYYGSKQSQINTQKKSDNERIIEE